MTPEIYFVAVVGHGKLYVMPKPEVESLATAIRHFSNLGVTHIVSHLEKVEENELGLSGEGSLLAEQGIELISHPIKDMNLPVQPAYTEFIVGLFQLLQKGANVAIHCRAGIGRTGLTSCCLLIMNGSESQNAIDQVAAARGTVIPDTPEQINFIHNFAATW